MDRLTGGRICHWTDTSLLTVARLFPEVGARLLRHCLAEWPVRFVAKPHRPLTRDPDVSLLIGVRGAERGPQLRVVLESLLGQTECEAEVLVVEQSASPEVQAFIPEGVRYIHTPCPHLQPYNRSWAFNVAASHARGRYLVLHDADMVAPERYAAAVVAVMGAGLEAARPPRLIFHLEEPSSRTAWTDRRFDHVALIEEIVQNNRTPIAITREAYFAIGGHDESFFGWGGEDNEFLDRCGRLRIGEAGFLPLIHLWHPETPTRSGDRNALHLRRLLRVPVHERIERLVAAGFGRQEPTVGWGLLTSGMS